MEQVRFIILQYNAKRKTGYNVQIHTVPFYYDTNLAKIGSATAEQLIELQKSLADKFGVKHIIIDSYVYCCQERKYLHHQKGL